MENEENKSWTQPQADPKLQEKRDQYEAMFRSRVSHNKALVGVFIVIIGVALLLKQIPSIGHILPDWLYSWPMIMIVVGAFIFLKNGFGGLPFILFGLFFLLKEEDIINEQVRNYAIPVLVILIGLIFILKRNHYPAFQRNHFRRKFRHRGYMENECRMGHWHSNDNSEEDFIDINSIFGNAEKSMFTKTFRGGNINCAFGGAKINLTNADIEQKAVLNISVAFGGTEVTVPANWQVQNELTAILGGIEDKRRMTAMDETKKTLVLRGGIFCGGVEIKN
ncbi:Cell wall-active antibiotics response 4TMS YvqF [Arachidicoccus rhizosphaerae]|uniref:Cell wall-active antibiotics response 4TMS YvqF n=1 Tax=Arachidicoccus rhizosphaerae TaxID=551991 RepID=A0A1H3VRV3_9BACT|nr:DUF5668 domain-containing protein [Arachidicoccus rhizosphaerae]SDZ76838.1 Cell wall-active antibiotics response 4TMS YvqF [Arachidicoccus rhizosphaerae]